MRRSAIVLTVLAVALVLGLALVGRLPGAAGQAERATALGLPILTVRDALAAVPDLAETDPIAVGGWYGEGSTHGCPAPERQPALLELYCHRGEHYLSAQPETTAQVTTHPDGTIEVQGSPPRGPYLDPFVAPLAIGRQLFPAGEDPWVAVPMVAIGHVRDHRAADCQPEDVAFCLGVFVIDHVAALRGASLPPLRLVDPMHGPATRTPEEAAAAAATILGEDADVFLAASMGSDEMQPYEDRAPPMPAPVVWLVRAIDHDAAEGPTLVTLVLDDPSLEMLWRTP